ncbi:MAG: microcystin-dependent protein [Oleispira sp.]|jgi:microcystin-dependent protein
MEGTLASIQLFGGNFAPRTWAFCNGQLLSISSNEALFSIVGTTYGGDGRSTYGLPELRGRVPLHAGSGPGLPHYDRGERGGYESVALGIQNLPPIQAPVIVQSAGGINIPVNTADGEGDEANPGAGVLANSGNDNYSGSSSPNAMYSGKSIPVSGFQATATISGGAQPAYNMQPFLAINYIICLQGIYPSRS